MTIPNITARTEVILDEIRLDIRDLLRSFVGHDNTQGLRDTLAELLTSYLYGFGEVQSVIVLCDENNNIKESELHADAMFVIDDTSFRADCSITPTWYGYNPDINVDITVRRQLTNKPERRIFYIDIGNATFNIDTIKDAFQTYEVDSIPDNGIDLEAEMMAALSAEIVEEIDAGIMDDLILLAYADEDDLRDDTGQMTLDFTADEFNITCNGTISINCGDLSGFKSQEQVDQEFDAAVQSLQYAEMPVGLAASLKV
jgi:hypothetical protein